MGYERISSWVESNFSPGDYASFAAFESAVRNRFDADGVPFPNGAAQDLWEKFGSSFEGIMPIESGQGMTELYITPSELQISDEFLKEQPLPEFFSTPREPVERFQMATFGTKFKGFFKKLFGRWR